MSGNYYGMYGIIYRLELLFVIGLPYGKLPRNAWAQPFFAMPE